MKDALIHVSAGTPVLLRPDVKPKHITLCAHVQKAMVETPTDNATDLNAERILNVLLIELALTRTVLTPASMLNNNVVVELNARLTSTKLAVFAQRVFKEILWLLVSLWDVEQTMTVDWTRLVTSSAKSVAPFVSTTPALMMPPVGLSTTSPNVLAIQEQEEMVLSLVSDLNLLWKPNAGLMTTVGVDSHVLIPNARIHAHPDPVINPKPVKLRTVLPLKQLSVSVLMIHS